MLTRLAVPFLILRLASAPASAAPAARCEFGGLKLRCPEGFKAAPRADGERFVFFHSRKEALGLFVAVLGENEEARESIAGLSGSLPRKLLPGEKKEFRWGAAARPPKVSKFEVGGGGGVAFNGNVLILVKFRHLRFGGKSFIVGYVTEFERGREAARMFAGAGDAEYMPGCSAVADVVFSVTGEEPEGPPCQLAVSAPPGE
jgi:hypothetical protein